MTTGMDEGTDTPPSVAHLPLLGVRVVDLTVVWSGPGATVLLGDLGAEVIRVEDLHRQSRQLPTTVSGRQLEKKTYNIRTFVDGDPGERPYERSSVFNWHARNKLSVTMSLDRPEGRKAFLALIEKSDVFCENNSPGVLSKLGIDYETLAKVNPRLIVVSMPPLGSSGSMSNYLGYGPNFTSLVGIACMDSYEGEDPSTGGDNFQMDESTPPGVPFAVMSALIERERTGVGQFIEFSQAENLMVEIGELVIDYQVNNRNPETLGNSDPHMLQGIFATRMDDRWIAISVCTDSQWHALVSVLALDDRAREVGSTQAGRHDHRAELCELMAGKVEGWDGTELFTALQKRGVPSGEVLAESRVLVDPHLTSRNWMKERSHEGVGTHLYPGHPWSMSSGPLCWGRPLPALGEDNEYVYKSILGYTDALYDQQVADGLIGTQQLA